MYVNKKARGGAIEGSGNFLGAFLGQSGSAITLSGPAMLGSLSRIDGFVHNGALDIGNQSVLLLDSDRAQLNMKDDLLYLTLESAARKSPGRR